MPYGLRIFHQANGTNCDFFFPDEDMPNEKNDKPYQVFRDDITTPQGNTFIYDLGKIKTWKLDFEAVSTRTKEFLELFDYGWIGNRAFSTIYFGTNVTGTLQGKGTYEASQIWGTGYIRIVSGPTEEIFDAWNIGIVIKQFGTNQSM